MAKVRRILEESPADGLNSLLRECADGARNVLHLCAAVCAPQPRKDFPRSLSSSRLDTGEWTFQSESAKHNSLRLSHSDYALLAVRNVTIARMRSAKVRFLTASAGQSEWESRKELWHM